jgi:hypothetical protein
MTCPPETPESRLDSRSVVALGDGRGDHDDHDGDQHVGQIGDQALEQVADRVGPEHAEGDLEADQEDEPEGQLGDDVRRVVLAPGQSLLDPATLDGAVEPDPFQDLVEDGGDDLGQQVAGQDDEQGGGQLGHERDDVGPGAGDTTLEVDGCYWHERAPCGLKGWARPCGTRTPMSRRRLLGERSSATTKAVSRTAVR